MRTITVHHGQSLMDIAIQYYGSASALFFLAADNNISLSEDILPNTQLLIRTEVPENGIAIFADFFTENDITVVSGQGGLIQNIEVLATNNNEPISTNNNDLIPV